jgi:hypothetical protein
MINGMVRACGFTSRKDSKSKKEASPLQRKTRYVKFELIV